MTHLYKTLAALGRLLFFVFAGFTASLVHDSPSTGPLHSHTWRALKYGPGQPDRYTLSVGMDSETSSFSNSSQQSLEEFQPAYVHLAGPVGSPVSTHLHAAKVPLPILKSVFLL